MNFFTYEMKPGKYNFEDLSKALFNFLQTEYPHCNSGIDNEFDDITTETKLVVISVIILIRFDEKSFFHIFIGSNHGCDYKHHHEYMSQKFVTLSTTNKIHLKCDFIDGNILSGIRQPVLFSFVLDKLPGYKVFSEPETTHYKKKQICFKYYNILSRR